MSITPIRKKWKSQMTDRERFVNQMHYKEVDRCFNMEFGYWDENYKEWAMFTQNGITNEAEANLFFSFDRIEVLGGSVWLAPSFEHKVVEETERSKIIMNGDGLLAEVPKDGHGSSIPHYLKSSVVTPDDWMKVKKERLDSAHPSRTVDIAKYLARHPNNRDYPLGVNCGSMIGRIRDMLTFEGLAYACFDYPDMVEDMVETSCVLVEYFLRQVLPHFEFDYATGWEDICFKNGPIVDLDFFRDIITPRYKRIHKLLAEHGIDIWYTDCDGDVRPLLPFFLEGGINCLFPFEVNGCAHPAELFETFGKELRIMGGVDKMQLGAGRAAIDAYLETLVPLVKRGGYIPFCDHRCPPNVPEEDYLYYLNRKEALFGMK
ncbi:MAG: hypothetical protein LBS36_03605 [Oscillospiraceae bacterium]|jgi:uroporphyrinogen decarboxylase|nr:hypothetical protein [Oscillospiraceae bacterium]